MLKPRINFWKLPWKKKLKLMCCVPGSHQCLKLSFRCLHESELIMLSLHRIHILFTGLQFFKYSWFGHGECLGSYHLHLFKGDDKQSSLPLPSNSRSQCTVVVPIIIVIAISPCSFPEPSITAEVVSDLMAFNRPNVVLLARNGNHVELSLLEGDSVHVSLLLSLGMGDARDGSLQERAVRRTC